MFTNVSKMKNKPEKDLLQKELEFYTNLLAQHAKNKEDKNLVLPCTSSSNTAMKRPHPRYNNHLPNQMFTFNKLSNSKFKTSKRAHSIRKNYIYTNPKNISILQPSEAQLSVSIHGQSTSSKLMFTKQNRRSPIVSKAISYSKSKESNYSKSNTVKCNEKMLNGSDTKVSIKVDCSKLDSKVFMNKEASVKSDSAAFNEKVSVEMKSLMTEGAPVKSDSKDAMNNKDFGKSDSTAMLQKAAPVNLDSKAVIHKKVFSKSDSKALMGEIAAVTKQLRIKSKNNNVYDKTLNSQRVFKNLNGTIKKERKLNSHFKSTKESSVSNNSFSTSLYSEAAIVSKNKVLPSKYVTNKQSVTSPKLQVIENCSNFQKNSSMHVILLNKLNAVEKLLNATTKNQAKVLNKVKKEPSKCKLEMNNNCQGIINFKTPNESQLSNSIGLDKKLSVLKNKYLKIHNFKLNKTASNDFIGKSPRNVKFNQITKYKLSPTSKSSEVASLIKSQYRVINKGPLTSFKKDNVAFKSVTKHVQNNSFSLVNNYKPNSKFAKVPKRMFIKSAQPSSYSFKRTVSSPFKKSPSNVCKKYNPQLYRSVVKHRQSLSVLENVMKSPSESSGIDVDLLLELAAENKNQLSKSVAKRRLYNRVVNSYSVQARTAKMIKTKYFNPYKKSYDPKNRMFANKNMKGYQTNYTTSTSKSNKSFQPKLKSKHFQQKKIVHLDGEKFLIGSTGRTLKKLHNQSTKTRKVFIPRKLFKGKPVIKAASPVSQIIASRALNRSINRALSASTKKKMRKINTYCKFYNRFGRCNKGVSCSFVHDPSKIAVCTRFLRGTCKNESCLFSHEVNPGKMAICSFFLQGACTKVDCPYLHEKPLPDAELCKSFVQGYCPDGKDCKKAHILICSKFLRGLCDKGKDCIFPHPIQKEKLANSKSFNDNQKRNEFQLETVLRYFESNTEESCSRGLVVPRIKSLPEQPAFISLTLE